MAQGESRSVVSASPILSYGTGSSRPARGLLIAAAVCVIPALFAAAVLFWFGLTVQNADIGVKAGVGAWMCMTLPFVLAGTVCAAVAVWRRGWRESRIPFALLLLLWSFVPAAFLGSALGPGFPKPPTSPVIVADIAGQWTYSYTDQTVTNLMIAFMPDGTFRQTVSSVGAAPRTQQGKWKLRGKYLELEGLLVRDGTGWTAESSFWGLYESRTRPGQIVISGGAINDADCWQELQKK